jgi:uncharacterized damage-inducible protein DinB
MLKRTNWFDRQFPLDVPIELLPNIVERLRGCPVYLRERVQSLSGETLIYRDDNKWSIQENAGHLLDLESLWAGRLKDFIAGREVLRPTDLSNSQTDEHNYNAANIAEILDNFASMRASFVKELEGLDTTMVERTALHPRLNQPMRVVDMAFFVAEHDMHHLARITELIKLSKNF